MKKLPVFVGMAIGAFVGLLTSISDEWGLKVVMMSIGALAGIAIGGSISLMISKGTSIYLKNESGSDVGFSSDERMSTYWRDKGKIYPMPGHPDPEGATRDLDHLP